MSEGPTCQYCDQPVRWDHASRGFVHELHGFAECDPYDGTAALFAEADDLPTLNENTGGGCKALITEARTHTIVLTNLDSDSEWLIGLYPSTGPESWQECGEGSDYIDTDLHGAALVELVRYLYTLDMAGDR